MNKTKKRWGIISLSFKEIMSYRMNIISISLSHILDLTLSVLLWKCIYSGDSELNGYTITEMMTYLMLSVIINSVLNTPRRLPVTISQEILSGSITSKLMLPISLYEYNIWYCIGRGMYFFIAVACPIFLLAFMFMKSMIQIKIATFLLFLISSILGYIIETGIAMVMCAFVFWTEQSRSIISISGFFAYLLSGRLIPIDFFPNWLIRISNLLPYRMVLYTPISIYSGRGNALMLISQQIIWALALLIIGKFVFKFAYKKVEIAGG